MVTHDDGFTSNWCGVGHSRGVCVICGVGSLLCVEYGACWVPCIGIEFGPEWKWTFPGQMETVHVPVVQAHAQGGA